MPPQAFQPLHALERVFATLLALLALAGAGVVTGAAVAERARLRAARSEREARRIGEYLIERQIGGGRDGRRLPGAARAAAAAHGGQGAARRPDERRGHRAGSSARSA